MSQFHHRSFRFTAFTAAAVLGSAGFLTGCGESDGAVGVEVDNTAVPKIALDAAIMQGDDHAVHAHIVAGTPVNTRSMMGDTPLHVAAALGRSYAVELLIGAGAELEATNSSGVTPLFNAAFFCHADVLQALIDAGAHKQVADQNGTSIQQVMEMPWERARPVYEFVHSSIGLPFDENKIQAARPGIAEMLR